MKAFVILIVAILLCACAVAMPFWLGTSLFPGKYAKWDFTSGRQLAITGWPAEQSGDHWIAPRRHVAIKTPGRDTKAFRDIVGGAFVERQGNLVRSVAVIVNVDTFRESMAAARRWTTEYGVAGDQASLDAFEQKVLAGGMSQFGWRGRGGGIELSLAGASSGSGWYFGVTFYLDGTSGAAAVPVPGNLAGVADPQPQ